MFTGIIETLGKVISKVEEKGNIHFEISSSFTHELKIDQSIAHNGVCLTVTKIDNNNYWVTAIDETLSKTNLRDLCIADSVNLERCMLLGGRLDGHIVQGHVDQTGICEKIEEKEGSWVYTFKYDKSLGNVTIEKGSICVNGISLTVFNSHNDSFDVAIIPYTYDHTNLQFLQVGKKINLEFDVIGKYVAKLIQR